MGKLVNIWALKLKHSAALKAWPDLFYCRFPKVKVKWQNYVWLFVEAVWVWSPLPTHERLTWKTQYGLWLAHLKEKWDNWIKGQIINVLFYGQKHDIYLEIKPDHSFRRTAAVLTDMGCSCVRSYHEKFQLFPFTNSQARIVIACDITSQRHWTEQQNEGGVGRMKKKRLNVFTFFQFSYRRSSNC